MALTYLASLWAITFNIIASFFPVVNAQLEILRSLGETQLAGQRNFPALPKGVKQITLSNAVFTELEFFRTKDSGAGEQDGKTGKQGKNPLSRDFAHDLEAFDLVLLNVGIQLF